MKHIYICKKLKIIKKETSLEKIYSDNYKEQVKFYKRLKNNMDKRSGIKEKMNKEETTTHEILSIWSTVLIGKLETNNDNNERRYLCIILELYKCPTPFVTFTFQSNRLDWMKIDKIKTL